MFGEQLIIHIIQNFRTLILPYRRFHVLPHFAQKYHILDTYFQTVSNIGINFFKILFAFGLKNNHTTLYLLTIHKLFSFNTTIEYISKCRQRILILA